MKLRRTLLVLLMILALTLTVIKFGLTTRLTQASESGAMAATATPESTANDSGSEHEHAEDHVGQTVAASEQEQIFQVTVTAYLMDTAGFHAMDDRINQEGLIEAGDAGVVNRVNQLLAVTAWPEDMQAQVDSLRETLSQYAEALANDDVEAAKSLATEAHELQHDLSHAVEHWLGQMTGSGEYGADEHGEEHDHSEESGG
jgi:hypothetical protein